MVPRNGFQLFLCSQCVEQKDTVSEHKNSVIINTGEVEFFLEKEGFRYGFREADGAVLATAHPVSGLQIGKVNDSVIVGGTGLATARFGDESKDKLGKYMVRYAQYASVNPSMAFGYGPWNFGKQINELCLKTAKLHDRLHPYIYSNAIKTYHTGFPYTMTPLPLAYPEDSIVYGLADTTRRSYQWLIGDALMACPLYGDDYAITNTRDVYLPTGTWIDYDTGKKYTDPLTLESFEILMYKTPLFVGGTGIVIEEIDHRLKATIYPVKITWRSQAWLLRVVIRAMILPAGQLMEIGKQFGSAKAQSP